MLDSFIKWLQTPFNLANASPQTYFLAYGGLLIIALLWHMILEMITSTVRTVE